MRTLTDLSGPRFVPGFSDYFTGFSLPDDHLFVFARTWFADEAERPGCVWTHSLLFEQKDIRIVPPLSSFIPFFSRPSFRSSVSAYELEIEANPAYVDNELHLASSYLSRVVTSLYGHPAPVLLPDSNSERLSHLHFALWDHCRTLTGYLLQFCTGAIQLRQSPRGAFDIQTIPTQSVRDIVRTTDELQLVDPDSGEIASWAVRIVDGLDGESTPSLKEFFSSYAILACDGRAAIGPYTELFYELNRASIATVIQELQSYFPERQRANLLKLAVAAAPLKRRFYTAIQDNEVLIALVTENWNDAFSPVGMDLGSRLSSIWHEQPIAAVELIRAAIRSDNEVGSTLIDEFVRLVSPTDIGSFANSASDVALFAIQRNMALAANPAVWRGPICDEALSHLIAHTDTDDDVLCRIVQSQIDSNVETIALRMTNAFGTRIADGMISWLRGDYSRVAPPSWQSAIESLGSVFSNWLETLLRSPHDPAVPLLSRLLPPSSAAARQVAPQLWGNAIGEVPSRSVEQSNASFCLFVLYLGMERSDSAGENLISVSFPSVYTAASLGRLDDRLWRATEQVFNARSLWDRCSTLRTALVAKFAAEKWGTAQFLKCFPSERIFSEILGSWGWTRDQKLFLSNVIQDVLSRRVVSNDYCYSIARQYEYWF